LQPTIPALCLAVGTVAGAIGSLIGIGGGSLTTPALILAGIPPHEAVTASLTAIMGTTMGGLIHLYRKHLVEVKTAAILETASTIGAYIGATTALHLPPKTIILVIAATLTASAILYNTVKAEEKRKPPLGTKTSWITAWLASLTAGLISATAGIGGGVIKAPILVLILGLDVKTAAATSKLMVGITAATGAAVYTAAGKLNPAIAAPLTIGTFTGAEIGARILTRMKPKRAKQTASILYATLATLLIIKTTQIPTP